MDISLITQNTRRSRTRKEIRELLLLRYPHCRPEGREEVERAHDLPADGQQARVVAGRRDELLVVRVEAPQLLGRPQDEVGVAEGARGDDGERQHQRPLILLVAIVV